MASSENVCPAWCKKDRLRKRTWFLGLILTGFFKIIETLSNTVFWLVHLRKNKTILPPIDDLLLLESASSLAKKIRTQQVTSEIVVETFIKRINAVNPVINCVVDNRFDLALEEARKIDKMIQTGVKSQETLETETPFLGVPFTVKNSFSVEGLLWTSGSVKRKNLMGQFDSDVVVLMKKAGAIVLATTNLPEICISWESYNHVFGQSRNPYDTNRTTGGSSGGEGGIISACGSPFGIGSDIAGSIRTPAFFNGIFGHKPTTGVVSNHAHCPSLSKILDGYLVTGPMTRFCTDLLPMFRILVGENISKLKLDSEVSLSKLRFFNLKNFCRSPLVSPVHPDLKEVQMKVVRHIEETFNIKVQEVKFPKLVHAMEMWGAKVITEDTFDISAELTMKQGRISLGTEILKACVGKSNHTVFSLAAGLVETISPSPTHHLVEKMIIVFEQLQRELEELLGNDGVLLVPSGPSAALYHNQTITKPFNLGYTGIFNVLGMPATQVPLGLGSWGVPLGVQVVSNLYNDHLTLAVAAELEKAFGGWIPPSPVTC